MGPVSIKLYDKQALVLRIETTVNDVSFFRHHRTVDHRAGTTETKLAPLQKTIYRLTEYQHMADFGTCAVDWPLLDQWEDELAKGFDPEKA